MREHVAEDVHRVDGEVRVVQTDVHVHAEDEHPLGELLHPLERALVTREGRNFLVYPVAHWVSRGSDDLDAFLMRQAADEGALAEQLLFGFGGSGADRCAEFHHRLVQLRFDLPLHHHHLAVFDQLGDERTQQPALRIDDLILLLDSKRQLGTCNHRPILRL